MAEDQNWEELHSTLVIEPVAANRSEDTHGWVYTDSGFLGDKPEGQGRGRRPLRSGGGGSNLEGLGHGPGRSGKWAAGIAQPEDKVCWFGSNRVSQTARLARNKRSAGECGRR